MHRHRCPSASLDYIVEPWFLGAGSDSPAGQEFKEFKDETEAKHGVKFATSLDDLPPPDAPRLALISGRTADNPRLLTESIKHGSKCIYLEKPGAPTVAELEQMKKEADDAGVEVLMGYNKNVCKYVRKTREFAATLPGSHVTFVSNNAYENTPESLGECFERNAEGMLKNMVSTKKKMLQLSGLFSPLVIGYPIIRCRILKIYLIFSFFLIQAIHELALLVSFYDVTVDNIAEVIADKEFSSMQTLKGPSGKDFTDFDKIKFTIKTKNGNQVSVSADRCGGTDSYATVSDGDGKEVFRYYMPDDEDKKHVKELEAKYPTAMPYFFTQDPDYITVKERVAKHTVDGEPAEGVATIGIAVDTLKVAEYLTPLLQEQLK